MNNIPTAEEILKQYNRHPYGCTCGCEWRNFVAMKEFAKLHVKAALEAASEKAKYDGGGTFNNGDYLQSIPITVNKESILNAYPENLIK